MNQNTANRYMKIVKELDGKYDSNHNLGFQNLYAITTLPEEERTQEQTHESCKIEAILLYALLPPYPRKNEQQA